MTRLTDEARQRIRKGEAYFVALDLIAEVERLEAALGERPERHCPVHQDPSQSQPATKEATPMTEPTPQPVPEPEPEPTPDPDGPDEPDD